MYTRNKEEGPDRERPRLPRPLAASRGIRRGPYGDLGGQRTNEETWDEGGYFEDGR